MRSDTYPLQQFSTDFKAIPEVAQKVADFNELDPRAARRLRLLSEELICMLPPLLIYGDGSFWICFSASRITVRLRRPKKSIFSRPSSSMVVMVYWVTMVSSFRDRGT